MIAIARKTKMSKVYMCDRCGAYVLSLCKLSRPSVFRFGRKRHLCDECERSFNRWFSQGPQERRSRELPPSEACEFVKKVQA